MADLAPEVRGPCHQTAERERGDHQSRRKTAANIGAAVAKPTEQRRESKHIERDHRDSSRAVGPLSEPRDAIKLDTTSLSEEQVVERIVSIVQGGRKK